MMSNPDVPTFPKICYKNMNREIFRGLLDLAHTCPALRAELIRKSVSEKSENAATIDGLFNEDCNDVKPDSPAISERAKPGIFDDDYGEDRPLPPKKKADWPYHDEQEGGDSSSGLNFEAEEYREGSDYEEEESVIEELSPKESIGSAEPQFIVRSLSSQQTVPLQE